MLHYNTVPCIIPTLASTSSVVLVIYLRFTTYSFRALTLHRLLFSAPFDPLYSLLSSPPSLIIATDLERLHWTLFQMWFYMWYSDWISFTFNYLPYIPLHPALLSSSLFPLSLHSSVFLLHVGACLPSALWISTAETVLFSLVNLCSKRACRPTFFYIFCDPLEHYTGVWFWSSARSAQLYAVNLYFQFPISTTAPCFWCFELKLHDHIPPDSRFFHCVSDLINQTDCCQKYASFFLCPFRQFERRVRDSQMSAWSWWGIRTVCTWECTLLSRIVRCTYTSVNQSIMDNFLFLKCSVDVMILPGRQRRETLGGSSPQKKAVDHSFLHVII